MTTPTPHMITTTEDIPEAVRELVREATHAGVANALMDFSDWVTLLRNNPARTPMSALTDPVADEFMVTRRDLVEAVLTTQPAISAEPLPVVAHRGPHDTDISMFEGIAERLEGDYPVGGSNVRDALVRLIRREIARAAGLTVAGEN